MKKDIWEIWENKEELLRAIDRNNLIGEKAMINKNDIIFDMCLKRNQKLQKCLREFKKS